MNVDDIESILESINVEDLRDLCRAADIKHDGRKGELIDRLLEVYKNIDVYKDVYLRLNDYEKELLDKFIEYNFHPYKDDLDAIREKYDYKASYWGCEYIDRYSPFRVLGLGKFTVYPGFYDELYKIRKPMEIKFTKIDNFDIHECEHEVDTGGYGELLEEMVKYFLSNKTVLTAKGKLITKKDFIKFYNKYPYDEILSDPDFDDINEIRTIEDTTIFYGIYKLLLGSHVFSNEGNGLTQGTNFDEFAQMNKFDKIKFLLEFYTGEGTYINEISRVRYKNYDTGISNPSFGKVRECLLDLIKKLPIESWVDMTEFYKFWFVYNYNVIDNACGKIFEKWYGTYYRCGQEASNYFIDVVLIEYLCSMGLIDVVYGYCYDDFDNAIVAPSYIRLTKMGAMVLGLLEYEEEVSNDLPLSITDDFKIIVNNTPKRFREEVYLNGIFECIDEYYNITFASIARYMDEGNKIDELINHLKDNADVPSNVLETLELWQENTSNIKVKTVKLIEADEVLKRVILNDKTLSSSIEMKNSIMFVKKGKEAKLKKDLEKKDIYINIK